MKQPYPQFEHVEIKSKPLLTPGQEQARRALESQEYITPFPYHSTVKFYAEAVGDAGGPYTYTITGGTRARAFSYGQGQQMQSAGFVPLDGVATPAETNLQDAHKTVSGENVLIHGIALQPCASYITQGASDQDVAEYMPEFRLLAHLSRHASVGLSVNGARQFHELGVIPMLPGAGGVDGFGVDNLGVQSLDGVRKDLSLATNGWPTRSNFFRCPEGILWRASGQVDSMLNIIFEVQRDIILHSGEPWNPAADEAAEAGVRGYDFPPKVGLELKVFLVCRVVSLRSGLT